MKLIHWATLASLAVGMAVPTLGGLAAKPLPARQRHQAARIEQGERKGGITEREEKQLKKREARLARQTRHARKSGGKLTAAERARMERRYNRLSRDIHKQAHDKQRR